jgi:outer membrane receptor for ferrienterochelin and colicin
VQARFLLLIGIGLLLIPLARAEVLVSGKVVDENNAAVGGARIAFRPAGSATAVESGQTVTSPTGKFELRLPNAGEYLVNVQHDGYFQLRDRRVEVSGQTPEVSREVVLVVNHVREVFQALDVDDSPPPIDADRTSFEQRLSGPEIMNVPVASTATLRNSLKIMPSVLQDPQGELHFNGGAENQVLYTLNGFNISDPLTGRFETRLSLEAVRSLEFSTGRFSPEFGKGSAGALAIQTKTGTDQWRYSGTNFIPGIDSKKGLHLGSWSPRANLSGPIAKGRIWFSDSIDTEYQQLVIDDLPKGQDRASSVRGSNLVHTQINLTPSNIIFTDFLVNLGSEANVGLGVLSPESSTVNRRSRNVFYSIKDQIYLARGVLWEFGFAENWVYQRRIPQGHEYQIMTPFGRAGNSFLDATQNSRRDQFLSNLFLPSFQLMGSHQVKVGIDLDRLRYSQDFKRTGYELFGVNGSRLSLTTFAGSGKLATTNYETSSYVVDGWRVRPNLLLEFGVRQDWDQLIHRAAFSPRASFSYSPFESHRTKIAGGYAVVYDASRMDFFARSRDQYSLTTHFETDGEVARGPAATVFRDDLRGLRRPRSQNWTIGVDQHLAGTLYVSVNLLRRRGDHAFTYVNQLTSGVAPPAIAAQYHTTEFDGIFTLTNSRKDSYDSAEVALRQNFGGQYEWMASYTRSHARSNAVMDQSIDQVLRTAENFGPLPWDSPHRLLSWGLLPAHFKNWSIAYLFETRSGFPFSVQWDNGQVVGPVNSHRLPLYFNLNLHAERRLSFRSNLLAIRGGFNNITSHANYSVANGVVGSPQFLDYYGSQGRQFVVRLRWLGREKN